MRIENGAPPLPPFVLVHGAFHGGWCWRPVARLLRAAGHEVYTPTLTGLGERRHLLSADIDVETFVLDVLNLIESEELADIVLVGHSFGGRPVSGVADRIPHQIRRVVYIDGGLPLDNSSRLDAMSPAEREHRISAAEASGGLSLPPPPARAFGMSDPAQIAWIERRLTPQPFGPERTALVLHNPLGNGRPVTYVHCTDPVFAATADSGSYARTRDDWRSREIKAGHNAIVTHAAEIAELLLRESHLPA